MKESIMAGILKTNSSSFSSSNSSSSRSLRSPTEADMTWAFQELNKLTAPRGVENPLKWKMYVISYKCRFNGINLPVQMLYRNSPEDREFNKEAAQVFASGTNCHCREQGPSEDQKIAAKLTQLKTDSSDYWGI